MSNRLALHNMYKLLNPTHIGTGYMVERLRENIVQIGQEKVQGLKGENVKRSIFPRMMEQFFFALVTNIIR